MTFLNVVFAINANMRNTPQLYLQKKQIPLSTIKFQLYQK